MKVETASDGVVLTVTINRPEVRNAVDFDTAEALAEAFAAFESGPECVAVLTGEGGTFCAGADLRAIAAGSPNRLEVGGTAPMGPSRMALGKPVIAAIAGHAVAGGLELAAWCDLRVMEADAILGVFCRRVGVPLIDGGTVRLPHIIGLGRALDLILTGRAVDADEALRIGLVDRVVAPGQSLAAAQLLAAEIATHPSAAMLADRASVFAGLGVAEAAALRAEFERGVGAVREGVAGARRFVGGD